MSSNGADHLSSVHNNPFVKRYGLPHHMAPQDSISVTSAANCSNSTTNGRDDEQEQEYHINSGFVNKLRSKFAQLGSKSNQVLLSRKSTSVENLLNIGSTTCGDNYSNKTQHGSSDIINNDVCNVSSYQSVGYKPQIKSGKQNLNHYMDKPPFYKSQIDQHKNHVIRGVKPPLPKRHATELSSPGQSAHNSSSEHVTAKVISVHHDWKIAPDVEVIGRDNIVIIESSNSSKSLNVLEEQKNRKDSTQDVIDEFRVVKPLTHIEKLGDENELPKLNSVLAYRTMFESTSKTSDTVNIQRSHHSTTRKSSVSDTNFLKSPLVRVSDDNIFERSLKNNIDLKLGKITSPRHSANLDTVTSKVESPRNSVNLYMKTIEVARKANIIDTVGPDRNTITVCTKNGFSTQACSPNIDTTSTSLQRSLELFQNSSEDKGKSAEIKCSSYDDRRQNAMKNAQQNNILTGQHKIKPAPPIPKVFDSKSMKSAEIVDRLKQLEPLLVVSSVLEDTIEVKHQDADRRKSLEPEKGNIQKIPKDTIELKHEADKRRSLELEDRSSRNCEIKSQSNSTDINNEVSVDTKNEIAAEVTVTGVTTEKLSSRKTKIFDSSDMVKKKQKPPNVPFHPVEGVSSVNVTNNVPKEIMVENLEIVQAEPFKKQTEQDSIVKANIFAISNTNSLIDTKVNIHKFKDHNFSRSPLQSHEEKDSVIPQGTNCVDDIEAPVRGMSSFLTSMKKSQPDQDNQLKTFAHPANGSSPSPVPRKRQAPERPNTNRSFNVGMTDDKSTPSPPSTLEPAPPHPNIDDVRRISKKSSQQTTKLVFDSSKIASKRKEPPNWKPHRKIVNEFNQDIHLENPILVPKLDLTSITNDKPDNEYQDGYIPTMIQPCPYVFIGADVVFERTPYKKSKKVKVKISFDDHATTTFEYEGEELALESYLVEHPEEQDEVLKQVQELESSGLSHQPDDLLHDSTRALHDSESHMKSNTVIGHNTGGLISYKSKMQTQEFQFGVHTEPDININTPEFDLDQPEPENIQLLPAEDNEADAFSSEADKSDMLF